LGTVTRVGDDNGGTVDSIEGGGRGTEGGGVDGAVSREAGSLTTTGSGTMMGALPVASRPKAGLA
jgi:hypothetical protein